MDQNVLKSLTELLSFQRVVQIIFVIAATWGGLLLLRLLLDRLANRFQRYRLQFSWVFPFLRLGGWLLATGLIIFGILKPTESIVLAVTASVGIAFGLAAQDVIRNALAGAMMLFDRPFRIGDMVAVSGHYGEIISMDLNVTRMKTFDDNIVTIPNAEILKTAVSNANSGELTEMVVVEFVVPATADVQKVRTLAREAAACCPYTYLKKPILVAVEDHFDRTFLTKFKVKAYVLDIRFERSMASDIIQRIKRELVSHNIIPSDFSGGRGFFPPGFKRVLNKDLTLIKGTIHGSICPPVAI